jgi:hypothetical protein
MTTWILVLWLGGHQFVVDYDLTMDDCTSRQTINHECREVRPW